MNAEDRQRTIVREHFRETSTTWGSRYAARPAKMSDMDLVLRRENVHRLMRPLIAASGERLRVLDLGCGTGDVLDGLSRESIHVTGTDIVHEMVVAAATAHPLDRFLVCDALRLPIAPASMDVVTCLGVVEYIPEPQTVLRQVVDVLRPGGFAIISLPNRASLFRKLSRIEVAAESGLSAMVRRVRGQTPIERTSKYAHRQWSLRAGEQLLAASGLTVCDVRFNTYGLWGRLGRWPISLSLSKWLSRRFNARSPLSSACACTMVFLGQKAT